MVIKETRDIYFAKCSKCGKRAFESFNESSVIERMKEEGWIEKNGEILCDTCAKEPAKQHLVLYHGSDLDGVFSAAVIARKYGLENVKCIPVNYGKEFPFEEIGDRVKNVWVVDFSFDNMVELRDTLRDKYHTDLIWCDHHESALRKNENANQENIWGLRTIGRAGCELTYEYIYNQDAPTLIQYLSTYDTWNKERMNWTDVMYVQYGVRYNVGLDVEKAVKLLDLIEEEEELSIGTIEAVGEVILSWTDQINEGYVKCSAFEGKICGVKAVFMNTNVFNSNVFKSYQGEYEVMVPFRYEKTGLVRFSIYADHNDKVNCAEMAERFGGGGHKGAAGFQLDMEKEKDLQLFIGLLKTSELNPE